MIIRVLVVDDEPDVANGWTRALRLAGYEAVAVYNAAQAEAAAEQTPFDVAVLDFIMPDGTGVELLAKLRRVLPRLRALIVSGKLSTGTTAAELTARVRDAVEADKYLHKPIENEQLLREVAALSGSEQRTWQQIATTTIGERTRGIGKVKRAVREIKRSGKRR